MNDTIQPEPSGDAPRISTAPPALRADAMIVDPGTAVVPLGSHSDIGPAKVYAIGSLGYEFPSAARRESFVQEGLKTPNDPVAFLAFLEQRPWAAQDVYWTLRLGSIPIYTIRPSGPFAAEGYARLRTFLANQHDKKAEQISVAGFIAGSAIIDDADVPTVVPDLRGLFSWNEEKLAASVVGTGDENDLSDWRGQLANFLARLAYEMRNVGLAGRDRALNYAATNAFMTADVFEQLIKDGLVLDKVSVAPSPFCPPGGECYDVILEFFNPKKRLEEAKLVYRYTIDVSDIIPISVDEPHHWYQY